MKGRRAVLDRRRFLLHWGANFASLGCLAVSGVLINSLIAKFYGAAALGVFNQVFAVYILGSQLATCGVQFSVLRYVAEFAEDPRKVPAILASAMAVTAAAATLVVAAVGLFFAAVGGAVYSAAVAVGVMVMLPGLWFFAVNKVLLNFLNGLQHNGLLALFTALRYLLMAAGIVAALGLHVAGDRLPVILSVSEALLLVAVVITCLRLAGSGALAPDRAWIKRHVDFGSRSMLGGIAVELNTRVDVLVLGLFLSDAAVGLYSFAAFFVEGILQLPQLSRRLVDPVLTRLVMQADRRELGKFMRKGRNLGGALILAVTVVAIGTYPIFAALLANRQIAGASWPVFAVLMVGGCVSGAYATFAGLFSQASMPGSQSRYNVVVLITNLVLNFALVPVFGVMGAAVATGASFVIGTFYFRAMVAKYLAVYV